MNGIKPLSASMALIIHFFVDPMKNTYKKQLAIHTHIAKSVQLIVAHFSLHAIFGQAIFPSCFVVVVKIFSVRQEKSKCIIRFLFVGENIPLHLLHNLVFNWRCVYFEEILLCVCLLFSVRVFISVDNCCFSAPCITAGKKGD